ncbi:hypothetical protein [Hymenobacter negativus]|uniref:Outer membrane protein beta-barrel domain-containing protein n=1 Tax=Hymenobacter negativus TaxID=2795026 RepID=A0ABS3QIZ5_9BACT|nr:hypothetical protein [Hymenobacter negativus]MBO2010958.1 hypothetical protein [Hymenobacter negativus]
MAALATVLLGIAAPAAHAQQVLVQGNVAEDTVKNAFGPNRHYFGHLYVGYGLLAGAAAPGSEIRYGLRSAELRAGGRLKIRFTQALAATVDLGYGYLRYDLAQNSQKLLPTPSLHRRETLGLHRLYSEVGLRLNYGRRGNTVGSYLDLLAGGGWVAGTSHTTEDDPGPGIGSVETTEHGLPYLRRWTTGLGARLGFDRYALTARYRTSAAYASAYTAWPELPRWVLGVEIGLF